MSFMWFKGILGQSLFWKCYCLFFSGAQNQCVFSPFQNCYIKMSWHMCLKCKIHKEKNPFNAGGILLSPFLHGTKKLSFFFYSWPNLYVIYLQTCMKTALLFTGVELVVPLTVIVISWFWKFIFLSLHSMRVCLILWLIIWFLAIQMPLAICVEEYKESV